ncbi:pyridoxal phosphate-dependent aminotransferase [Lacipirellula sp.]|uniref:pyridoxal phosphate-dependent aminotransferase n=1 Tax=Lacipirellula sp. TaxID=2691419 RepID=UPI003D0A0E06
MLYLRWVKELTERLRERQDVINLAGSAFHLPAATAWLHAEIGERGASLVATVAKRSNEFGLAELKERIRTAYQVPSEREILLTSGSSGAIRFVLQLLLAGDGPKHFIAEQPIYEPLLSVARRLGATVELAPRCGDRQFVDEVATRLKPLTAAVVLTNPHNPSGDLLSAADLRRLVEAVAARTQAGVVVVDETFADLSSMAGWSMGNIDQRIVTVNGLTKCYGLGSLRCGWATVDRRRFPEALDAWIDLENIGCPWTEILGARAVEHFDRWRPLVAEKLAGVRATTAAWLDAVAADGLLSPAPVGESCVVFPRWLGETPPLELVERLIDEYGVVVAPGEFFYPADGIALRIGFGGDEVALAEGLDRLRRGLRAVG